jgi:hypothetical protein
MSSQVRRPRWVGRANLGSTDGAQDTEVDHLAAMAADPASSRKALWRLAHTAMRHPALARTLAGNPALPRPLMWYLGRYARWDVAAAVARNPRCSRRIHAWQVYHSHWAVRAALASSTSADRRVLRMLVTGQQAEPRVLVYAAANPALDPDLVAVLLSHRSQYVRAVAAGHPAASSDQLRHLTEGLTAPAWVLRAAAANPSCPPELADQLLTWIALGGPRSSDPMFDPLECTGHPGDTEGALNVWYTVEARSAGAYKHPLWRVRAAVAHANQRLPIEEARELCRDPRPEVRRSVAGLVGISMRNVRELMGDADAVVASRATFRRQDNIERARRKSSKWMLSLALRLGIPAAILAGGAGSQILSSAGPPPPILAGGAGSQILSSAGPAPIAAYRCDRVSSNTSNTPTLPAGQPGRRRDLPGNGWLTCGRRPGGRHADFVLIAASQRALTVHFPAKAVSGNQRLVRGRIVISAGHRKRITLPDGPPDVVASITPHGGKAIMVDLSFPGSTR